MQAKMTSEGLLIPQEWLQGFVDFEIHHSEKAIVILPAKHFIETVKKAKTPFPDKLDPLLMLGEEPIEEAEITDVSVNHDKYIYSL